MSREADLTMLIEYSGTLPPAEGWEFLAFQHCPMVLSHWSFGYRLGLLRSLESFVRGEVLLRGKDLLITLHLEGFLRMDSARLQEKAAALTTMSANSSLAA